MSSRNAYKGGQRDYYRGIAAQFSALVKEQRKLRELIDGGAP